MSTTQTFSKISCALFQKKVKRPSKIKKLNSYMMSFNC